MTDISARARQLWDDALHRVPDQAEWVARKLQEGSEVPGLVGNGRFLLRVARPRLISADACDADQAVVTAVTRALDAASRAVLDDPDLARACLGSWADDDRLMRLFALPSGYEQSIVFGRYDGVRSESGVRILEFNGGLPGGIGPTMASARFMATWPQFAALEHEFSVDVPDLLGVMVEGLVEVWHSFGGEGNPRVALIVPTEFRDYVATALAILIRAMEDHGLTVTTCDPGDLVRRDGAVHDSGGRVDVAVRVFFTSMITDLGDRLNTMVDAVQAGELCMVTSFRAGLMGHKSLFALVTDPQVALDVPEEDLSLARAHLPWTRIVGTGATTGPDGQPIDLADFAVSHREQLVLKPADGTGGAGVMLGWEQDPAAWQAGLDAAESGVWILQERIALTVEEIPVLEEGFPLSRFQDDYNPLVFNDRIGGYFVRLSETGGITNLTSGDGTVIPTFIVRPRS